METPTRAAELNELLRLTGVSPHFRADDHAPAGPRVPDTESARILGVISPVNKSWTFVVHEDGLVLVPEPAWRRLVDQRRPITVSALVAVPKSRSVPWDCIEQLRRVQLGGRQDRIVATVRGAAPLDVKTGPRSGEGGHPYAALRDHLGERYRAEERIGTRI